MIRPYVLILLGLFIGNGQLLSVPSKTGFIEVANFGAIPDDGIDDAPAIRNALNEAKRKGAKGLIFEAGRYDLMTVFDKGINRKIGFEEDYPNTTQNNFNPVEGLFYIGLEGLNDFVLMGATNNDGTPATWLVRSNPVKNYYYPPHLMYINKCNSIEIKNIAFDNAPYFYTAGIITEINKNDSVPYVVVEILEGHPRVPDMGSFVMGCYDIENRKLLVGRLTWNSIGNWQPVEGGNGRLMKLVSKDWFKPDPYFRYMSSEGILGKPLDDWLPVISVGQTLFWFQNFSNSKQVIANNCENIYFTNINAINSSGFVFEVSGSRNITLKKISVTPGAERVMVAPRDAFKIKDCSGKVLVENCHFEGVNDDVQNVHTSWFWVKNVSTDRSTVIFSKHMKKLEIGSKIGFYNDKTGDEIIRRIKSCKIDSLNNVVVAKLNSVLPSFVDSTVKAVPYCFLPEKYIVRKTVFKNIKGSGILLKASNVIIDSCVFENIDHIGLHVGARYDNKVPGSEAGISKNVIVRNNIFKNCGRFINRKENPNTGGTFFGDPAAISLDVDEIDSEGSFSDYQIYNNRFIDIPTNGIYIRDAKNIKIFDNIFEQIKGENVVADPITTRDITIDSNY